MKLLTNNYLEIPDAVVNAVINQNAVRVAPHDFYKYPARFSPTFPCEVIKHFSNIGDTVIDPFCGSGTTLVEAVSQGRNAVGFDVSSLAVFLSKVKTASLSRHDITTISNWLESVKDIVPMAAQMTPCTEREYYQKNAPASSLIFFNTIVEQTKRLPSECQRKFIRLMLLATGQWALDCKTADPKWGDFKNYFSKTTLESMERYYEFLTEISRRLEIPRSSLASRRRILNCSCEQSGSDKRIPSSWLPAKLVVTSPPYPGVHVLYHRWQVNGRRETPLPFWLAATRDGAGESFYSLGSRGEPELVTYFRRLKNSFESLRKVVADDALIFQLVAFSQPDWQLPLYLKKMEEAGFTEQYAVCESSHLSTDGRIWRNVPGRRWYANKSKKTPSSREVLLVHKPLIKK